MKKLLLIALAVSAAVTSIAPAEAGQGCGPGFHRGPNNGCRPNRGPAVVAIGVPRIGVFYHGRGYWDGNRYWGHRDRWHGGWRYR
ncbi:GCG_CRPN prefix-to-repeats domain-containing protein [Sphingomonas sp. PAMC 26605]|uniref:GCG_CRPN prefix-to-repeats domain-containing protein n=1 Tax=Sphingomonas sp. PAMC 26605 TaxID=1112214 RepID=UPI00026CD1F8